MIGVLFAGVVNVVTMRPYPEAIIYWRGFPPPEMRLYGAMIAGPCLVVGTFFMGWTSQYAGPVPWYVPALSTPFIGTGVTLIFMSFMVGPLSSNGRLPHLIHFQNYLVDTYAHYAASAFAANVIVRCLFAAAFPLFTNQMYTSVSVLSICLATFHRAFTKPLSTTFVPNTAGAELGLYPHRLLLASTVSNSVLLS